MDEDELLGEGDADPNIVEDEGILDDETDSASGIGDGDLHLNAEISQGDRVDAMVNFEDPTDANRMASIAGFFNPELDNAADEDNGTRENLENEMNNEIMRYFNVNSIISSCENGLAQMEEAEDNFDVDNENASNLPDDDDEINEDSNSPVNNDDLQYGDTSEDSGESETEENQKHDGKRKKTKDDEGDEEEFDENDGEDNREYDEQKYNEEYEDEYGVAGEEIDGEEVDGEEEEGEQYEEENDDMEEKQEEDHDSDIEILSDNLERETELEPAGEDWAANRFESFMDFLTQNQQEIIANMRICTRRGREPPVLNMKISHANFSHKPEKMKFSVVIDTVFNSTVIRSSGPPRKRARVEEVDLTEDGEYNDEPNEENDQQEENDEDHAIPENHDLPEHQDLTEELDLPEDEDLANELLQQDLPEEQALPEEPVSNIEK